MFKIGGLPIINIGRSPDAELTIKSPAVSRLHARIYLENQQYFIEDLRSSNGTTLNGARVESPRQLKAGDQIALGKGVTLDFVAATKRPAGTPVLAETEAYEDIELPAAQLPSQLVIVRAGFPPETHDLHGDEITIGRSSRNDIAISSEIVSRNHARLIRTGDAYSIEVLPEATNQVLFEGRPVKSTLRLQHNDKLRIGGSDPGSMVTMLYLSPAEAAV